MKDSHNNSNLNSDHSLNGYQDQSASFNGYTNNQTYQNDSSQQYSMDDVSYSQSDYNSYAQNYDYTNYNNGYYDQSQQMGNTYQDYNGYQNNYNNYQQPNQAPNRYSQADYDYMAQNPTYLHSDPNKMDADDFFRMAHEHDQHERRKDQLTHYLLTGRIRYRGYGEPSNFSDKDIALYLVSVGFGLGLLGLFHAPFYIFPIGATFIAFIVSLIKKLFVDNMGPVEAIKDDYLPLIGIILGIILTIAIRKSF